MRSTKKREIGLGDNLYGIPLDDIMTPEEINSMRKDTSATSRRKRRERKRKAESKKPDFNKIKLPQIKFTEKTTYIIAVTATLVLLFLIFKNPIIARFAPKVYIADAWGETVSSVEDETERIIKNFFGFDLFDKKELSVLANGSVISDSLEVTDGISVDFESGFSQKNRNAIARWRCVHNSEEFFSTSAYMNEEEIGISIPQLFGEYWVAPAKTFGKEWNESGLRKVLYADSLGEDADFSFSNTFGRKVFISKQGKKKAECLTEKFISSAKAKYNGKTEIAVNGNSKLAQSFLFEFRQQDIVEYITEMMSLVTRDNELSKVISSSGKGEQLKLMFNDFSKRLEESIVISDAHLIFSVYKGAVRSVELDITYSENGQSPRIVGLVSSSNLKNITDDINLSLNVSGSDKDFSYTLSATGNHSGADKQFTDTTLVSISKAGYEYSLNSDIALDFKNGSVNGNITGTDNFSSKTLTYNGICAKKGGLKLQLDDVKADLSGNQPRSFGGKLNLSIVPDMKTGKINTANKKLILDYSKAEAENYIMRLEQTDSAKKFIVQMNTLFNKTE